MTRRARRLESSTFVSSILSTIVSGNETEEFVHRFSLRIAFATGAPGVISLQVSEFEEKEFSLHGRGLRVRRLTDGWEVVWGERSATERYLDQCLASVLDRSPGSVLQLTRAVLERPSGTTLDSNPPFRS